MYSTDVFAFSSHSRQKLINKQSPAATSFIFVIFIFELFLGPMDPRVLHGLYYCVKKRALQGENLNKSFCHLFRPHMTSMLKKSIFAAP